MGMLASYCVFVVFLLQFQLQYAQRTVFEKNILKRHNELRNLHMNTPPMRWHRGLAKQAQKYCGTLERRNIFVSSPVSSRQNPLAGENLWRFRSTVSLAKQATDNMAYTASQAWYAGIKNYDFDQPGYKKDTGQFTQLVWVNSVLLGCGLANGLHGNFYSYTVCCRYSPPGNYLQQFEQHVHRPKQTETTARDEGPTSSLPEKGVNDRATVRWGDWGYWSGCDDSRCNVVHRARLCLADVAGKGTNVLDPSHCEELCDKQIETKQCCEALQNIRKRDVYDDMYNLRIHNQRKYVKRSRHTFEDAIIKAGGSRFKVDERKKLSWVVSLKFKKTGSFEHKCGGVILSNKFVITAAHCITDDSLGCWDKTEKKVTCDMTNWRITAGEWNLVATSVTEQNKDVEHITVHTNYSEGIGEFNNDIALIKLKTSLEFMDNPYIQPCLLPARGCIEATDEGECTENFKDWALMVGCFTTGWGIGTNGEIKKKGHTVEVFMTINTDDAVFVSRSIPTEKPVCEGYSGSPLMCSIDASTMCFIPPQDMVVLGLNSFVNPSGCVKEAKTYTQTSVTYFMEWISNSVMEWVHWGKWSKCKHNVMFRLRSGFFPEYGYIPGDGPLYQSYGGDVIQMETRSCQ
ncbi:unnamed protein product [Owenia fusiformis]|uniref:Uncharacterized protein n=1 Tax=Owenia fusiformis TaxID=6347 RepID=A0A8J1XKK9_OWEFU|nr:unnamed protein product [Owenia fusiformis]